MTPQTIPVCPTRGWVRQSLVGSGTKSGRSPGLGRPNRLDLVMALGPVEVLITVVLPPKMTVHQVHLKATAATFQGLAKQNMLFHQALGELVDNALAAGPADGTAVVSILFKESPGVDTLVDLFVQDRSGGMTTDKLSGALQLGNPPDSSSRLNEHGFGLKNALATLTAGGTEWQIWTRQEVGGPVATVRGPFESDMSVEDDGIWPADPLLDSQASTIVFAQVRKAFVQTVQGRGARATDLTALRRWLLEHLGVMYRGYLSQDPVTLNPSARLSVLIGRDEKIVRPLDVPMIPLHRVPEDVSLGGEVVRFEYEFGKIDEHRRDNLLGVGEGARFYYQGNIPTQGIDIRIGKRVIATRQLEQLWRVETSGEPLHRHNGYNEFVGELRIPDLPRGVLSTVNNKTDFNLDDPDWQAIFEKLRVIPPPRDAREQSEKAVRDSWIRLLRASDPRDTVTDEHSVWPTGTRIDVYRENPTTGEITIYEVKVDHGEPQHVYQLRMYWDGLVLAHKQPTEAWLIVQDYNEKLQQMVDAVNAMPPPEFPARATSAMHPSSPYRLVLKRLHELHLAPAPTAPPSTAGAPPSPPRTRARRARRTPA
jgi:Histidine kinase-, DNA gyrase B-, and HSP90-like ATPase